MRNFVMPWAMLLITTAGCVGGCGPIVYPGDGRLVIVEIDPALDACPLTLRDGSSTTVGATIRTGIRMWDQAGAKLRTVDQLGSDESEEAQKAPRLHIRGDAPSQAEAEVTFSGTGYSAPSPAAEYRRYTNGEVYLYLRRWVTTNLPTSGLDNIALIIAHETGHAIGLEHVPEQDALMNIDIRTTRVGLSDADMREYARVWPRH